jgi:uncharacterized protein YfeS
MLNLCGVLNISGEILVVKWLLYDKKCRPGNQWSENGDTVLHRMIDRLIDNTKLNNKQIPKIIKEIMPHFKCNLVMKNKEGNTPLHAQTGVEKLPHPNLLFVAEA